MKEKHDKMPMPKESSMKGDHPKDCGCMSDNAKHGGKMETPKTPKGHK